MKFWWFGALLLAALWLMPPAPARAQIDVAGMIAFIGRDGNLYLIWPDGSGQTALTDDARNLDNAQNTPEGRRYYSTPSWSPDGQRLLFIRNDEIYSTSENRLLTGQALLLYEAGAGTITELALETPFFSWKPDSSGIYYQEPYDDTQGGLDPSRAIGQMTLPDGQPEQALAAQNGRPLVAPRVSPDGRYLTFEEPFALEGRGYFGLHDLEQGTTQVWDRIEDVLGAYVWTPDSQLLVFDRNGYVAQPGNRIWKSDPTFQQVTPVSPEISGVWFYSPVMSPSGDKIAALAQKVEDGPTYIWVMGLYGEGARELLEVDMGPYSLSWSPTGEEGKLVASAGQYRAEQVVVIDVFTGQTVVIAEGTYAAWNPLLPRQPGVVMGAPATATIELTAPVNGGSAPVVTATAPDGLTQAEPTAAAPIEESGSQIGIGFAPRIGNAELLIIGVCLGGLMALGLAVLILIRRRAP